MTTKRYTISAFSENSPGVLHRITVIFTRRKINIASLTVSETERKGISRFTIVLDIAPDLVSKVVAQIRKIFEVVEVQSLPDEELLFSEIAFIRVGAKDAQERSEIEESAERYGATISFASNDSLVVEKAGTEAEVDSLYLLLGKFTILEFVRSGRIAIEKNRTIREEQAPAKLKPEYSV